MKVKNVQISNFRGVRDVSIDFSAPGEMARSLTAVFGDNCAGKTTVLQAVGLVLAAATGKSRVEQFPWHGFIPDRISTLGRTSIEIMVGFEPDEIQATRGLFEEWRACFETSGDVSEKIAPDNLEQVTLQFDGRNVRAREGRAAYFQFRGRYYLKQIATMSARERAERFKTVGDVFWFDQYRNLGSAGARNGDTKGDSVPAETWVAGVEALRQFLVGAWTYHVQTYKGAGVDHVLELEPQLARVFPGIRIVGVQPRQSGISEDPGGFYFLFERAGRMYDLAELSSGEQAVFPLVYEFVRLSITRSVVLVDEVELHLHPPEQQALLAALPRLGADCQFIVSSHSPYLMDVVPVEAQVRMSEGRRCQ